MPDHRHLRNLALVGFMGTGKSSVGRLVARQLGFAFVDSDHLIEKRCHKTIVDLFTEHGEGWFRDYEGALLREFENCANTVISTGGGASANETILASLKRHSLVICLWASPETIYQRVRRNQRRPLVLDRDPLAQIRRMLAEREHYYRQADVLISAEWRYARDVAQQVVHQYRLNTRFAQASP
jgi:shikimate kinase